MASIRKIRKKRTRWGADLDDETDDLAEHVEPEELPLTSVAPADPKIASSKRKRSRWGEDKAAEVGIGGVVVVQDEVIIHSI